MRRTGTELAVEREVEDDLGTRRRYRVVGRFEPETGEATPTPDELARLLAMLSGELDAALAAGPIAGGVVRADRSAAELIEAYHPRQVELVDLLLAEGEITRGESTRLREYLTAGPGTPVPSFEPAGVAPTDRPIAAAPLAVDRTPTLARPVDDLLRLYRIESLKQAGAVRGRRQISYEEYMALKRHFGAPEAPLAREPARP